MPMTCALLDVDAATLTRTSDGAVTVDDPDSPLLVTVVVDTGRVQRVTVETRHPTGRITPRTLSRLPLHQLALAAGATTHPNEAFYRRLAHPKPAGQRGWDDEHWRRVLAVHDWAVQSKRPGGGARAVAEFWGVTVTPTARRWLAHARRRAGVNV